MAAGAPGLAFRELFDSVPDRYLVLSPTLTIVAVSDAYLRVTMTTREAILGRNVFDVFPDNPDDPGADGARNLRTSLERVRDHLVADAMAIQKYDIRRPEAEGGGFEERYWSPVNSPVFDHDGRLACIIHRVEDVTGARRAVDALSEANEFLATVLESIPHMVFVKDAGRLAFVRFNRTGEELLGLRREDSIGKTDHDLFPKEQADFFQSKDRETLRRRTMVDITEESIQTRKGTRLLRTKKVPVLDAAGEARYLLGISEDITDLKASEAATAQLAAIVESTDDAILGQTVDGVITSWNGGAARLFGYSADEAIGRPVAMLAPPDLVEEQARVLERLRRGERVAPYDTLRRRSDGRDIDVSVTVSPIGDRSGRLIGISKIARDITAAKRTQQELVRAKEETETSNRDLEAFSYSVAHDLRAPLRSIDGFSQALLEDYSEVLDAEGTKYLTLVRRGAQLMAELIDGMLALARVTRHELGRQKVDLSAMARAAHARLELVDPTRTVEVVIEDGLECHGDPRLLTTVLDNLLGNAWKFTRNRIGARIEVGAAVHGGARAFFVRDNGAGFDMAYADKLFGVFQRLHSVQEFEGTGVGLATSHRVIRRHGGRIWAEGRVGAGATFYFTCGEEPCP